MKVTIEARLGRWVAPSNAHTMGDCRIAIPLDELTGDQVKWLVENWLADVSKKSGVRLELTGDSGVHL